MNIFLSSARGPVALYVNTAHVIELVHGHRHDRVFRRLPELSTQAIEL